MRDVARVAGVSVSTVANVLNNPDLVAAATRQRVEDAMGRVGFVRSGPARQLRGLPSRIVGTVILDLANPFYAELNRGIEDRLAEAGCLAVTCSTDVRVDREAQILQVLEEQAVRGIIISPTNPDLEPLIQITRRGTPVVLLDHPSGRLDLCAVAVDNVLGGQLAAEHLIALGHRRIALLRCTVDVNPVTERRSGVRQALHTAGLDPAQALLEIDIPVPPTPIVEAADAVVDKILALADPPTAVICLNDTAALGILRGLDRLGIKVPTDVSVVGYDDLRFAAQLDPALTTIEQPKYQLGRAVADLLLDENREGHLHQEVRFRPTLVVRRSTGPRCAAAGRAAAGRAAP